MKKVKIQWPPSMDRFFFSCLCTLSHTYASAHTHMFAICFASCFLICVKKRKIHSLDCNFPAYKYFTTSDSCRVCRFTNGMQQHNSNYHPPSHHTASSSTALYLLNNCMCVCNAHFPRRTLVILLIRWAGAENSRMPKRWYKGC